MPTFEFLWKHFPDASLPTRSSGPNNSYSCFDCLERVYGVYVFRHRESGIVEYVGRGGTRRNEARYVLCRLKQHYTKSKTGATFYKRWREIEHPNALQESEDLFAQHGQFLNRFSLLSLSALVISDHSAVDLVPAIEHMLIHTFRPKYQGHQSNPRSFPTRLSASMTVDSSEATLQVRWDSACWQ